MDIHLVYMTAKDKHEARNIGKQLVESKLAACVNIVDPMTAIYVWEGELQEDQETVVIAKTTSLLVPELVEKVKEIHSYECPCVVSMSITGGNPDFLGWIRDEVQPGHGQGTD